MLFFKRLRMWWAYRQMALVWRKTTGGSLRYRFDLGGGQMSFSAPEAKTLEELADLLEDAVKMIRSPKTPMPLED